MPTMPSGRSNLQGSARPRPTQGDHLHGKARREGEGGGRGGVAEEVNVCTLVVAHALFSSSFLGFF